MPKDSAWTLTYSFDCSNLGPGHADLFQLETYQPKTTAALGGVIFGRHAGGGVIVNSEIDHLKENIVTGTGLTSTDKFPPSSQIVFDPKIFFDVTTLCNWHLTVKTT